MTEIVSSRGNQKTILVHTYEQEKAVIKNIKTARVNKGMKVSEIVAKLDISPTQFHNIMQGRSSIRLITALECASILGISISELFNIESAIKSEVETELEQVKKQNKEKDLLIRLLTKENEELRERKNTLP